jgi:hypothetical protein
METIIAIIVVLAVVVFSCLVAADSAASRALAVELLASEEADETDADLQSWLDDTDAALSGPIAACEWELATPCRVTAREVLDMEAGVAAADEAGVAAYERALALHGSERKAERASEAAFERAYRAHQQLAAYDALARRAPSHRDPYPPLYV